MKHSNTYLIAASVVALAFLAGGVGIGYQLGNDANSSTQTSSQQVTLSSAAARASATDHNDADATFAQMMVPHHQQALEMAKLADTRASSDAVKQLAATIEGAQQPEIDQMNS